MDGIGLVQLVIKFTENVQKVDIYQVNVKGGGRNMKTVGGRNFNPMELEALIRADQLRRLVEKAPPEVKQAIKIVNRFFDEHRREMI